MIGLAYAPEKEFFIYIHIIKLNFMSKSLLIRSIIVGFVYGIILCGTLIPQTINADLKNSKVELNPPTLIKNGHLTICKMDKSSYEIVKTMKMVITGYSSTEDQTDDTPFITASGKKVTDGIIANNMLPFGTKIRIPELYGNKIFTVEDRMHKRMGKYQADIWFPEYMQAKKFGAKITEIEVLES